METIALKKITVKEVCEMGRDTSREDTIAYFKELSKSKPEIMVISGKVVGYQGKSSQFGESFFLIGNFFAQNRMNGNIYEATKAYLPNDVTESIKAAFDNRRENEDWVKIQLSISVVPDSSSATGYTYITKPVATPETINERATLLATFAALPAPKPASLPAPGAKGETQAKKSA